MKDITKEVHAEAMVAATLWHETMFQAFVELGDRLGGKIHIVAYDTFPGVKIPAVARRTEATVSFPDNGAELKLMTVTLNIRSSATTNRAIVQDKDGRLGLSFNARFSGVDYPVYVPLAAIVSIYYPDAYLPQVDIPTAPLFDWLFVNSVYPKDDKPVEVAETKGAEILVMGQPPRGKPTLTVVK